MHKMRGVILAGGKGTRLLPATRVMNKHLIPILNEPMILYPLKTLRDVFGITDVLIVSLRIGMRCLFITRVAGRSRVPLPPASITPRILCIFFRSTPDVRAQSRQSA
jgi:hypothetical protein